MRPLDKAVFQTLRLLKPYDVDCAKQLVGGERDGGYVLACLPDLGDVLSIGVDHNDDFDLAMAERGHRVHMFDHTVEGPPHRHERFRFHKTGVCGVGQAAADLCTIEQMVVTASLSPGSILKIDVEGAEWDAFSTLPAHILTFFDQVTMEIHWLENLTDPAFNRKVTDALSSINSQFTLFHVHGNNNSDVHIVGGLPVVSVLELSYVRTSRVRRRASRTIYPCWPNRANRQDYFDLPLLFYPFMPCLEEDGAIDAMIARVDLDHDPTTSR